MKHKVLKISIIMPSYNQGQFIKESIDSVLNQDYPHRELIIIDGGSTDDTVKILESYGDRIAYWISEKDKGQSDALNKGLEQIKGDVIGWLNSDDLYAPGCFSTCINIFQKRDDVQVVMGDHQEIDIHGDVIRRVHSFDFNLKHFVYEGFHCNAQSMLWRKTLMDKFGLFDVSLHRTMDYDMILRFGLIAGNHGFYRIDDILGVFRRHDLQKTQDRGEPKQFGLSNPVYKEHFQVAKNNGFIDKFTRIGRLKRFVYRIRRAYWYIKRGGIRLLLNNIRK